MTLTTVTTTPSLRSLLLTTLCTTSLFSYVHAHMEMETPKPWDAPTAANAADRDYNIKSPLSPDGSDFPCKGLDQAQGSLPTSATWKAGQTYNTTIDGTANHSGGSCQLSLSYDNGKTWKVIKSMIGGCPTQGTNSFEFTIPMTAPSGTALFAWSWINHTGNREFYMNCAVVTIQGQQDGSLCMFPNLYVANLKGINSCVSPEGTDTMYPHPGSDVVFGDGMSASSPVTGGSNCEIPAPVCSDSGFSGSSQSSAPSSSRAANKPASSGPASRNGPGPQGSGIAQVEIAANTAGPEFTSSVEEYIASVIGATAAAATGAEGATLTSLIESYIDSVLEQGTDASSPTPASFPTDIGSTVTPATSLETSTLSLTATLFRTSTVTTTGTLSPNATAIEDTASLITSYIESVLSATPQPSSNDGVSSNLTSPLSISSALVNVFGEATALRLDSPILVPSSSTAPRLPYVPDPNVALYLPCTPGNFLCKSASAFFTCDQPAPANVSALATNGWAWGWERPVADGMMCLPFERVSNATEKGPSVRDDRYVRARPDGDCSKDGSVECVDGGKGFWVCDHGGWVDMGAVANGTLCVGGGIVRA
ncbi:hypothetical protein SLS57_007353 [Botryosphaeria dothidea]